MSSYKIPPKNSPDNINKLPITKEIRNGTSSEKNIIQIPTPTIVKHIKNSIHNTVFIFILSTR